MDYNKLFILLNLILVTFSANCMDPEIKRDLNNRFVAAAKAGDFDAVQTLFAQGAQIDGCSKQDNTALMKVAENGNVPKRNKLRRGLKAIFYEEKLYELKFDYFFYSQTRLCRFNI